MTSIAKLKEIIQPIVDEASLRLYDVAWVQEGKMQILQVSIMKQDGSMDIDTCATVSSQISETLDTLDIIDYEYYLEVCSPGAERELRSDEEIKEAINEYVYVKLKDPQAGLDEVKGYLLEVQDDTIKMDYLAKNIHKKIDIDKENIRLLRLSVKI